MSTRPDSPAPADPEDSGAPRTDDEAPLGGSEVTEEELEADIAVEEDTLKTLEGEAPTG
ncbi:hypothetical protein ACWIBQ_09840 [Microbacterium keratanolyticum]